MNNQLKFCFALLMSFLTACTHACPTFAFGKTLKSVGEKPLSTTVGLVSAGMSAAEKICSSSLPQSPAAVVLVPVRSAACGITYGSFGALIGGQLLAGSKRKPTAAENIAGGVLFGPYGFVLGSVLQFGGDVYSLARGTK